MSLFRSSACEFLCMIHLFNFSKHSVELTLSSLEYPCLSISFHVPGCLSYSPLQYQQFFYCCSVTQLGPIICDPMDCSMPGLPVHHQLPELTQTHVHWVGDAIQPSHHPLLSPSPPAFKLSQHQGLFKWVRSSHQVAKLLKFQLQHQFFQWIFRIDAEAEAPILWPPDTKSQLIRKDSDSGKDWRREKGTTEDEMVGWHHQLGGQEFE